MLDQSSQWYKLQYPECFVNEEQRMMQKMFADFTDNEILPVVDKIDDDVSHQEIVTPILKKLQVDLGSQKNLIPKEIDGVPTDIVEIGEIKALNLHPLAHVTRIRPLVAGVSIGNWAITAGTLGWYFKDGKGREMLGSNAHVFADNPLTPSSFEKRIVQPGRFDQGNVPDDVVGNYYWHRPLSGSECIVSNAIMDILNGTSRILC